MKLDNDVTACIFVLILAVCLGFLTGAAIFTDPTEQQQEACPHD